MKRKLIIGAIVVGSVVLIGGVWLGYATIQALMRW